MNDELQRPAVELVIEKLADIAKLLARVEYEATKKVEMPRGSWIEWNGGERPVPMGTLVDVVHRNGSKFYSQLAGASGSHAEDWSWADGHPADIISYRIVPERNK